MRGVVGLDLSLRRAAACWVPPDWSVGDWGALRFCVAGCEVKGRDPEAVADRLVTVSAAMVDFISTVWPTGPKTFLVHDRPAQVPVPAIYVEDYGFGAQNAGMWLAELAGAVKCEVRRRWKQHGAVVVPVNQNTARKTFFGDNKLPQGKGAVPAAISTALRRIGFPHEGSDEGDAAIIAWHGRSLHGMPAVVMPTGWDK